MVHQDNDREWARLWRERVGGGLELLQGVFRRHVFSPHFHRTYLIELVERGLDVFECDGTVHRAAAGSLIFINPGEVHTGRSLGAEPLVYRSFYPSPFLLREATEERATTETSLPFFVSTVVHDPELFEQFQAAHRMLEPKQCCRTGRRLFDEALRTAVTRHARPLSSTDERSAERVGVSRARAFMDEAFAEPLRNDQLTHLAGLSEFHFIRTFSREVGLTPHEYLVNVRVEHARSLLAEGTPIAHAARRCGFYDQSHLNRHFKRITGVTPGQYRRLA